jgi:hypothetical protein
MTDVPFTFYEFFAGGGMARQGLGSGWSCLFAKDIDTGKAAAYATNFGTGETRPGGACSALVAFPCDPRLAFWRVDGRMPRRPTATQTQKALKTLLDSTAGYRIDRREEPEAIIAVGSSIASLGKPRMVERAQRELARLDYGNTQPARRSKPRATPPLATRLDIRGYCVPLSQCNATISQPLKISLPLTASMVNLPMRLSTDQPSSI